MIHPKKIEDFVDHLENEICIRVDIDSFSEFKTALAKELFKRYSESDTHAADIETVRKRLNDHIEWWSSVDCHCENDNGRVCDACAHVYFDRKALDALKRLEADHER